MRRLTRRLFTLCSAASLVLCATACCGINRGPTQGEVESWLATVPPGSSGDDAFALLRARGFKPKYYLDGNRIYGRRNTDTCAFLADWVDVFVQLDDAGRVVSSQAAGGQNYP